MGKILAKLEFDILLANDVLIKRGDMQEDLYFLVFGTVAWYSYDGFECSHYEDGSLLGQIGYFMKIPQPMTVVATQTCEIFRWNDADVREMMVFCPDLHQRILSSIKTRSSLLPEHVTNEMDINRVRYQLKKGKILEHTTKRQNMFVT